MSNDGFKARVTAHLGEALRWNPNSEVEFGEGVVAGLGFVGPIILAAILGNLPLGLAASAGSLSIAPPAAGRGAGDQAGDIALALLPTIVAAGFAVALADAGWTGKILAALLAGGAALVGGFSRTAAIVTTRFTLLLIITLSLAATMSHRLLLMLLLTGGAAWTALLWLLFGTVSRMAHGRLALRVEEVRSLSATAERFARWSASMRRFSGLQYALKLAFCVAVAALLDIAYPAHHLHWISLTVVLLAQRRTDFMPVKITQRALGAALGGIVAGIGIAAHPPAGLLIAGIGLIAGTRPLLKARHYLSYSAMMTTLIVLMMDFEQPLETSVLADRTIATLIGGVLVVVANLVADQIAARLERLQQ